MSPIELTDDQRRQIEAEHGQPVDVIDPATKRTYVLLARELYDKVRSVLSPSPLEQESAAYLIPPGILLSQQAFWRDLPELLKAKRNRGKWVCYHGDERIGIAREDADLIREVLRRGIANDAYYLAQIRSRELPPWAIEEIEAIGPHHLDDYSPEP